MKVLVINCGSSSLKYQLIDMVNEEALAQGLVERIGIEGSFPRFYGIFGGVRCYLDGGMVKSGYNQKTEGK